MLLAEIMAFGLQKILTFGNILNKVTFPTPKSLFYDVLDVLFILSNFLHTFKVG